ncbi:MAG: bacillithiol biosynthesis cysteine-adding enzyme BshC [Melioribacteraceae bacterium]|nr:bacillithiol biosynthesis cysteine-adding enzyme BshC [Melioribacteraceae bacterium]
MYINYSDLPGQQNLFLDYVYEFDNVQRFYKKNFRNFDDYANHFLELTTNPKPHRKLLSNILKEQYKGFKTGKLTQHNIELLSNPKTIAIVTGQQLGILGGPLYTFYKTITVIKLANSLKEKFDDYNFVPVFWMEGDDHDFKEISFIKLPDKTNTIREFGYEDRDTDGNSPSTSEIRLGDEIEIIKGKLRENILETEFTDELFKIISGCYGENETFSSSFRKLFFHFFDEFGLVIFNPTEKSVKEILKPIFKKEIDNYKLHAHKSVELSAELDDVYHAQVKVKPINLFMLENGSRHLVEPAGENEFRLKDKRKHITKEELLAKIENEPELFSPNVLLRPVCQDHLFPTGCYVAGPSEISYFAQALPLYDFFDVETPIIFPRSSATILENNVGKKLEKLGLNLEQLYWDQKSLKSMLVNTNAEFNTEHFFAELQDEISGRIQSAEPIIVEIDPTLKDSVEKSLQKIMHTLDLLEEKISKARERKYDTLLNQLNSVRSIIYPNEKLQEREFNFIYFTNKYGLDFVKWVYNQITINKFEHQIIEL